MKFYSQYRQDEILNNKIFKNKQNGVFVEIGADDGIDKSNTLFYEESLNWTGIAIEAREKAYNKLKNNRKCICINAVLSDKEQEVDFMSIEGYGKGLSGIVKNYEPRHAARINEEVKNPNNISREIIKVRTSKLNDILEKYNLFHIDYLSIDTEGSELDILKTIDFNKFYIDIIDIEDNHNNPLMDKFFNDNGYEFIQRIEIDNIYRKKKNHRLFSY